MITVNGRKGLTAEALESQLRGSLDGARKEIDEFTTRLLENPMHAMEWSMRYYRAAAEIQVLQQCIRALEAGQPVEIVGEMLLQILILQGENGESSSLATSNLLDRARLQVTAALLKRYFYS